MNVTAKITFYSKTQNYKINDGPWMPAWNYVTDTKVGDFGIRQKLGESQILFVSDFDVIELTQENIPIEIPTTVTLMNPNNARITDDRDSGFNFQELFTFRVTYATSDFTCLNIYGDEVDTFEFSEDGVVNGTNGGDNTIAAASINAECCTAFGYTFDPDKAKCYWSVPCIGDGSIKVVLNADGNDGALFQIDEGETCTLDIEFDWLLEFDCEQLLECVGPSGSILNVLSGMSVGVTLERVIPNPTAKAFPKKVLAITYVNESILTSTLFDGGNILNYFQSENSGIILVGDNCDLVVDRVEAEINDSTIFTQNTLYSNWMHFKMSIVDPSILELITNEKIKITLKIGDFPCELSILVDNIQMNRVCQIVDLEETFISQCPSFNLDRVIDNKKSWVAKTEQTQREFSLSKRETGYDINHHKLGINSKEVDINISPARAIETDVMATVLENGCILSEIEVLNINTLDDFKEVILNAFIDVKSRQTISSYPALRELYDVYLYGKSGEDVCRFQSNELNYGNMDGFINLIGTYWVELIEQVIPSTTIWGSTYKYSNTIFDTNKFKYRKGSLIVCDEPDDSIGAEPQIGVIKTITTYDGNLTPQITTEACNGVYMSQINDGSEFIGSVTILGQSGNAKSKGDIIILNETLVQ